MTMIVGQRQVGLHDKSVHWLMQIIGELQRENARLEKELRELRESSPKAKAKAAGA